MQDVRENFKTRSRRHILRFVPLGLLCLLTICPPSKAIGQAGTVYVDTTSNTIDGDTRSVAYLLEDKGADGKISFHEAIRAINNSQDNGYIVRFSLPYGSVISPPGVTLKASNTTINGDMNNDTIPDVRLDNWNRFWGLVIESDHNIIMNLAVKGIRLYGEGTHHNYIYNCYIGMDVTGHFGTAAVMHGIAIHEGAHHNYIQNNKIAGNINIPFNNEDVMAGIFLRNAHENEILGNWIGLDVDGQPLANDVGIIMEWGSSKNIVGGNRGDTSCNYPCNVIVNQKANAIIIRNVGSDENGIQGNYIGVAPDGITPMGNGTYNPIGEPSHPGVVLSCGASDNVFGGERASVACDGPCNVISATESLGIHLFAPGTQNNKIQGNYIGLSVDGSIELPNWGTGIELDSEDSLNQCGSLSGTFQSWYSLEQENAQPVSAASVLLKTDLTTGDAIHETNSSEIIGLEDIDPLSGNIIGGEHSGVACTGPCNVISGNRGEGIMLSASDCKENMVLGNYIGISPDGSTAMPNIYGVVLVGGASENVIGGERASEICDGPCNVISGNGFDGIALANVGTSSNQIQGNVIGMNPELSEAIPNGKSGILFWWSPSDNLVGGPKLPGICRGTCNVIAGNNEQGVLIEGDYRTRGNTIRGNAIYANGGLGIDLDEEGVTYYYEPDQDDVQDAVNFPQSVSAVYDPETDSTTVRASLTIEEAEGAIVDFYANEEKDPTGYGEGQWYLGEGISMRNGTFELIFEGKLEFSHVSATATNVNGSTSEFGRRPPLIFIPGGAGSTLVDGFKGDELWVGSPGEHYRLSLYPDDNYSLDIYATDAIRKAYGDDVYQSVFDRLIEDGNYVEYPVDDLELRRTEEGCYFVESQIEQHPDLFIFAYDWRHGVQTHTDEEQGLRDYIGCIQTFYPGSKVDILAHSMGGLLARRYILDYSDKHYVNKLITVATPYLGAPKAIYVMETGDWAGFVMGLIAWPDGLRYITGSFPGAHQLLPTRNYYNLAGESESLILGGAWDSDDNSDPEVTYDYDSYKRILDERYGQDIFEPITISEIFRNHPGQEDWSGDNSGVDYFILYGSMDEGRDKTVGRVGAVPGFVCKQYHPLVTCTPKKVLQIKRYFIPGDETVPAKSAIPLGIESVSARVIPFYGSSSGGDKSIKHGDITSNPFVMDTILGILTHGWDLHSGETSSDPSMTIPSASVQDRYYVTIFGGEEFDIPEDGDHFLLGNRADLILFPTSSTYILSFLTTDEPLAIEITRGTNTTATLAIRYVDLPLPSGVEARLILSDQGVDDLVYDEDGDGNFESVVPPTLSLSGAEANDLEPPVIEVRTVKQGEAVLVTLEATDAGSGIHFLYYSLDGENFEPYTSELVIDPEQTPLLYAFADDNVRNRVSLIYPCSVPEYSVYLPIVIKH